MTSEASGDAARWILFDAVEIDLTGRRLFVDGRETPLEPKAFAVLALLARQPGRAFARDEILDVVWGHRHVTPGVLNRIVALLRRALGETTDRRQYLHTLYGVGYRFDAPVRFSAQRILEEPRDSTPQTASAQSPAAAPEIVDAPGVEDMSAPPPSPASQRRPARAMLALSMLTVLTVLAVAGWVLWQRASSAGIAPTLAQERGIAVLPLANVSGAADQQFFSDGLSDNLITTLSQYDGLKVIGRSSSFVFRDGKQGAAAIGARLGVDHLVEGSVQRVGEDVRVSIELVRTADGSTVWTRRFDRPYKDLFALQDEIALAVAGALQVKLLYAMPSMVETGRPASGNLDAYEAYLRATAEMSSFSYQKAIREFEQATRIDPDYAQAWSWLALARTLHAQNSGGEYAQARKDVDTALRLQPDFGQAHAIRANLLRTADHDWDGALAEFRIALPLVSDTDPTHGAVSILLGTLGRVDEAIVERRKYIAGDPLAAFAHIYLAELLTSRGLLDDAEESLRDADRLNTYPTSETRDWRASAGAIVAILRGDAAAAVSRADTMKPGPWHDSRRALALQIGPDRAAADAALQRLVEADAQGNGDAYSVARVYALRGDADRAFAWLQRDLDRGGNAVHGVLRDSLLLRFRDDPRFAAYCAQAGLPAPSQSQALGIDRIRAVLAARR